MKLLFEKYSASNFTTLDKNLYLTRLIDSENGKSRRAVRTFTHGDKVVIEDMKMD